MLSAAPELRGPLTGEASEEPQRHYKLFNLHELLALEDDGDRWLMPNMVPWPGRTLIYGFGGTYKSTIFFDLSVAVASGGSLIESAAMPVAKRGPVLILSSEGDIFSNRDRLLSHMRLRDLDPANVPLFYGQQALLVDTPEDRDQLIGLIEHVKPVLLVIDPLVSFFSGDENSVREMKLFLHQGLDPLIDKYKMSVAVIHHSRRDGEIRGSSAMQAWADSMLCFNVTEACELPGVPEPVDVITVECKKQRNGGAKGTLFSCVPFIDSETGVLSWGIYDDVEAKGVSRVYLRVALWRKLLQAAEPLTRTQIREAISMPRDKIDEALEDLVMTGVAKQTSVSRSTGGGRARSVAAFSPMRREFVVDQVRSMLGKARTAIPDRHLLSAMLCEEEFRVPAGMSRVKIPKDR